MSACQVPLEELLGSPTRATLVISKFDPNVTSSPTFFGSLASANHNPVVKHTIWTLLFEKKKCTDLIFLNLFYANSRYIYEDPLFSSCSVKSLCNKI